MSDRAARAELIEDRGEAAVGDDFFRSRPFLDAEGVTHTLRIEAGEEELLAPLIVREIPATGRARRGLPLRLPRPRRADPTARAGVEVRRAGRSGRDRLLRHRAGQRLPPPHARRAGAAGGRARARRRPDRRPGAAAEELRSSDRKQIRKNRRNGYELRLVPGPETERGAAGRLPRRLRADDAPRRRRRALLLRRRLLRPHPRGRRHLARPRPRPRRGRSRPPRSPPAATASSTTT